MIDVGTSLGGLVSSSWSTFRAKTAIPDFSFERERRLSTRSLIALVPYRPAMGQQHSEEQGARNVSTGKHIWNEK